MKLGGKQTRFSSRVGQRGKRERVCERENEIDREKEIDREREEERKDKGERERERV